MQRTLHALYVISHIIQKVDFSAEIVSKGLEIPLKSNFQKTRKLGQFRKIETLQLITVRNVVAAR